MGLSIEYEVRLVERPAIKDFIEEHHYTRSINGVNSRFCFAMYSQDGTMVGAMLLGQTATTAWKKYGDSSDDVLELRRLVCIDETPKNAESFFIGRVVAMLKAHAKGVKVIVSYADPQYGHGGTIYKATNFLLVGKTAPDVRYFDGNRYYHSRALRTRGDDGEYKPFVKRLRALQEDGKLEQVKIPGKYIYVLPMNRYERRKYASK